MYELVSKLKVTRTKGNLIYERELRRLSPRELDDRVKSLLKRPLIQKSGEQFVLEVEIHWYLITCDQECKSWVMYLMVRFPEHISLDAIVALLDYYIEGNQQEGVKQALVAWSTQILLSKGY
ncbi:MAG: hypothetical protein R3F40_10025 [Candidatus Competibacteraceae bacterium]